MKSASLVFVTLLLSMAAALGVSYYWSEFRPLGAASEGASEARVARLEADLAALKAAPAPALGELSASPVTIGPAAPDNDRVVLLEAQVRDLQVKIEQAQSQVEQLRAQVEAPPPASAPPVSTLAPSSPASADPQGFDARVAASLERMAQVKKVEKLEAKRQEKLAEVGRGLEKATAALNLTEDERQAVYAHADEFLTREAELRATLDGEERDAELKRSETDFWIDVENVIGTDRFDDLWRMREGEKWAKERAVFETSAQKAFARTAKSRQMTPDEVQAASDTLRRDAERIFTLKESLRPTRDNSAVEEELKFAQEDLAANLVNTFGEDGFKELQRYYEEAKQAEEQPKK